MPAVLVTGPTVTQNSLRLVQPTMPYVKSTLTALFPTFSVYRVGQNSKKPGHFCFMACNFRFIANRHKLWQKWTLYHSQH